jgi:hypothetical protein
MGVSAGRAALARPGTAPLVSPALGLAGIHGSAAVAVLVLLLWFNFDRSFSQQPVLPTPSLAQQLREFARDLQEKARTEGLRKSLQLGQELAKVAERNLAEKTNDEQLKKDLAAVKQRLDANDKSGPQPQDIAGAAGKSKPQGPLKPSSKRPRHDGRSRWRQGYS